MVLSPSVEACSISKQAHVIASFNRVLFNMIAHVQDYVESVAVMTFKLNSSIRSRMCKISCFFLFACVVRQISLKSSVQGAASSPQVPKIAIVVVSGLITLLCHV